MTDIRKMQDEETGKIDYSEHFRRNVGIEKLAGMPERQGWTRKGVITNYPAAAGPELVRNFETHEKAGFSIVMTTESIRDDRVFSPNSESRPKTVPSPLTGKTSDGYEYVVMEIENSKLNKHLEERSQREHERFLQSTGQKVSKKGNQVHIQDNETKF